MIARTKAPRKRIRVRTVTQESINLGTFILQNGGRGSLYPVTMFSCHIVIINNISNVLINQLRVTLQILELDTSAHQVSVHGDWGVIKTVHATYVSFINPHLPDLHILQLKQVAWSRVFFFRVKAKDVPLVEDLCRVPLPAFKEDSRPQGHAEAIADAADVVEQVLVPSHVAGLLQQPRFAGCIASRAHGGVGHRTSTNLQGRSV